MCVSQGNEPLYIRIGGRIAGAVLQIGPDEIVFRCIAIGVIVFGALEFIPFIEEWNAFRGQHHPECIGDQVICDGLAGLIVCALPQSDLVIEAKVVVHRDVVDRLFRGRGECRIPYIGACRGRQKCNRRSCKTQRDGTVPRVAVWPVLTGNIRSKETVACALVKEESGVSAAIVVCALDGSAICRIESAEMRRCNGAEVTQVERRRSRSPSTHGSP
jgi:hypothetical protein